MTHRTHHNRTAFAYLSLLFLASSLSITPTSAEQILLAPLSQVLLQPSPTPLSANSPSPSRDPKAPGGDVREEVRDDSIFLPVCRRLDSHGKCVDNFGGPEKTVSNISSSIPTHPSHSPAIIPPSTSAASLSTIEFELIDCETTSVDYSGDFTYCSYLLPNFAHDRGLTILTTPTIFASLLTSLPAFQESYISPVPPSRRDSWPFYVQPLPGKGMSALALRTLHPGDLVIQDHPSSIIHMQLEEHMLHNVSASMQRRMVDRLPGETRKRIWDLHGWKDDIDELVSKIHTNSFELTLGGGGGGGHPKVEGDREDEDDHDHDDHQGAEEEKHYAVVPEVSRLNHDCRPNVAYHFDPSRLLVNFYAVRTIFPGEELTISYRDVSVSRDERHSALQETWGFGCTCSSCSLDPHLSEQSDLRLEKIRTLQEKLNDWSLPPPSPLERKHAKLKASLDRPSPELAEYVIELLKIERLDFYLPYAYKDASYAWNAVGNGWKARKWAEEAIALGLVTDGLGWDDLEGMMTVRENPEDHWSWMARV